MDISCTATDGNPLPKVIPHHQYHHHHHYLRNVIKIIIIQVSLSLDGTVLGSSSLSFTTNFVAANHHHDQEIVCEVCDDYDHFDDYDDDCVDYEFYDQEIVCDDDH